jgi:hypothetical protein
MACLQVERDMPEKHHSPTKFSPRTQNAVSAYDSNERHTVIHFDEIFQLPRIISFLFDIIQKQKHM